MARDVLAYSIGNAASTTLAVAASNSDTSATITSDTNFAAKSGEGMIIIDESQATEELAYSTGKTGAVLTIPLANRGLEGGSAQGHAINATVKGVLTAAMWNDMIDALTNVLVKSTGAVDTTKVVTPSGTQTLTNKTIATFLQGPGNTITVPATTDTLVGKATTDTLTNKRITKRVGTTTSSATPSINVDSYDIFTITALATAITSMTSGLSGTPTTGQPLIIRIKDDGTARAITWGASFASRGATLPTTTVISKYLYVGLIWNEVASVWDCIATAQET